MTKQERYQYVINYFVLNSPDAKTELIYDSPYQLLVAVILSAQCTDKRVNLTTPAIFTSFPDIESLSKTTSNELFPFIKSISYPNNKTNHLIGMALMKLPGVGRKTANVITSVVDKQPNMAVDTHVFRVANRIGLVKAKTPLEAEKQLVKNFPKDLIHLAHHWLILHGRYICVARKPKCPICGLKDVCKYYQSVSKST